MNFRDDSKNKIRKIDFSFDSAHCASFMKMGAKMRWAGESTHPYLVQGQNRNPIVFRHFLIDLEQ